MPQPIIKRHRVKLSSPESTVFDPEAQALEGERPSCAPREKTVRLLNDGAHARAIEFTCSCGEVTIVELLYADPVAEEKP